MTSTSHWGRKQDKLLLRFCGFASTQQPISLPSLSRCSLNKLRCLFLCKTRESTWGHICHLSDVSLSAAFWFCRDKLLSISCSGPMTSGWLKRRTVVQTIHCTALSPPGVLLQASITSAVECVCVCVYMHVWTMSHVVCVCANQNNFKSPDYKTASCVMRTVEQSDDYESHVVCTWHKCIKHCMPK